VIFNAARFLRVKGTLALGETLPFAGRRGNEGLGRFMRTRGASSPSDEEPATHRVLEELR